MASRSRFNCHLVGAVAFGAAVGLGSTAMAENIKRMNGNFCIQDTDTVGGGTEYARHLRDGYEIQWTGDDDKPAAICPFFSTEDLEIGDPGNGDPVATNVDVTMNFGDECLGTFDETVTVKVCVAVSGTHSCASDGGETNIPCDETYTVQSSGSDLEAWSDNYAAAPYVYVLADSTTSVTIAGYKVYD